MATGPAEVESSGDTDKPDIVQQNSIIMHFGAPVAILTSIGFHLTVAITLLINVRNKDLLLFSGLDKFSEFLGLNAYTLAASLIILASLAAAGILLERRINIKVCTALVLPQYSLMLWSLVSDIIVIFDSKNPATNARLDPSTILAVLAAVMWISIGHTYAFIERYIVRWLRS